MLNQVLIVGRVKNVTKGKIKIAVNRSYKNEEGIYECDIVPVCLNGHLESSFKEYCKVGDVVGIKGAIHSNGKSIYINADKVTFLSSKKEDEKDVENE